MKTLLELAQKIYEHDIARGLNEHEAKEEALGFALAWLNREVDPETMAHMSGMSYKDFKLLYMNHNDLLV